MRKILITLTNQIGLVNKPFAFILGFVLILSSIPVQSQTDIGNYFAIQYFKVHPSQENEFIQLHSNVWQKIHAERIENDLLDGWYLFRVIAPQGTNTEYNFLIVQEYDDAEKFSAHFDGYGVNYNNILSTNEIQHALTTNEISDMTYEEVWTTVDQIMTDNSGQIYKYSVFNSMKMKPGVDNDDYVRMEKEYWKPMHKERIRRNMMFGWGMYTMIIPGGTERNYHWATVDYYHNFMDYLCETGSIMESIHGKENADKYTEETISKRDLLKAEIRELIAYKNDSNLDN
tara:strand:- start:214 stop:1074 length:861 start_codon:yes stop_codon:yes gene_type:complete